MTHQMNLDIMTKFSRNIATYAPKTAVFAAAGLLLVACGDNSKPDDSAEQATQQSEVTNAADSKPVTERVASSGAVKVEYSSERTIDGVAFGELSMGDPNAPITMIEYASLTCSHCAAFHNNTLPLIKEKYIETGEVRLVYRNYILNQYDLYASMITRCAGPEKAFGMMSLFFNRQSVWMQGDIVNNLASLARRAGMNRATFDQCLANRDLQADILTMREQGNEDGVTGTPTFLINGALKQNGDMASFEEAFEDAR